MKYYKYYTVYKTTNKINGKVYYGAHRTNDLDNDDYIGSGGNHFQNALNKYGEENFEKEILYIFDNEADMDAKEIEIIAEENAVADPNCYNKKEGGEGGRGYSLEVRLEMSKRMVKYFQDDENKIKQSKAITKYYKNNPEARIKHSEFMKEYYSNSENRFKQSESQKERFRKQENRIKLSNTMKAYYKDNPEAKKELSKINKGRIWITNGSDSKMIPGCHEIPDGWYRGRIYNRNKKEN